MASPWFAFRPQGTARNVWRGVVDGVDHLGDRACVRVRGPVTIVSEMTGAAVRDLHLTDDTEVWVSIKATEIDVSAA